MLRVSKDACVDVLRRNVGVNDGGDSNCRDCNSPNCFADYNAASRRKSRRGDVWPDVDVDDDGGDNIESGVRYLQEGECLWPVIRIFELSDDAEEDGVASCERTRIRPLVMVLLRLLMWCEHIRLTEST